MRRGTLLAVAVVLGLVVVPVLLAATKNSDRKIRLKAPSGKTPAGGTAILTLKLKNRVAETRDVMVDLVYQDAASPYATETVTLGPKEKRTVEVDCPVPADFAGKKLRVYARTEGLEDSVKVRVAPAPVTDEQWIQGRDQFQSLCAGCHGSKGSGISGDSLDRWVSAMRSGPGSMPTFPSVDPADIRLMREFTRDPNRVVIEPPPGDATYDGGIKALLDRSCVACHTAGFSSGGIRLEIYEQAFANRAASLAAIEAGTMPKGSPLGAGDVALFRDWVGAGAPR